MIASVAPAAQVTPPTVSAMDSLGLGVSGQGATRRPPVPILNPQSSAVLTPAMSSIAMPPNVQPSGVSFVPIAAPSPLPGFAPTPDYPYASPSLVMAAYAAGPVTGSALLASPVEDAFLGEAAIALPPVAGPSVPSTPLNSISIARLALAPEVAMANPAESPPPPSGDRLPALTSPIITLIAVLSGAVVAFVLVGAILCALGLYRRACQTTASLVDATWIIVTSLLAPLPSRKAAEQGHFHIPPHPPINNRLGLDDNSSLGLSIRIHPANTEQRAWHVSSQPVRSSKWLALPDANCQQLDTHGPVVSDGSSGDMYPSLRRWSWNGGVCP